MNSRISAQHADRNGHGDEPHVDHYVAREVHGVARIARRLASVRPETTRERWLRTGLMLTVMLVALFAVLAVACSNATRLEDTARRLDRLESLYRLGGPR